MHNGTIENHSQMHEYFYLGKPQRGKSSKQIVSIMILQNFYNSYSLRVKALCLSEGSMESCQSTCNRSLRPLRLLSNSMPTLHWLLEGCTPVRTRPYKNHTVAVGPLQTLKKRVDGKRTRVPSLCAD